MIGHTTVYTGIRIIHPSAANSITAVVTVNNQASFVHCNATLVTLTVVTLSNIGIGIRKL